MPSYTQDNRKFRLTTPLGKDVLLFKGIEGSEGISRPFEYKVLALAENTEEIRFDELIGQKITVSMKMGRAETECHINGLCRSVSQGRRDHDFTVYRLVVVPELWTLTRILRSRIFQQKTVPEILKEVLEKPSVDYRLEGRYEPRDYCAQYRETDFNFVSRLMEEEGIYYYFSHTEENHTMVIADSPAGHDPLVDPTLMYEELEGGVRDEEHVHDWEKTQQWTSGKVTLWDHCFEMPTLNLEAQQPILSSIKVGTVNHKLKLAGNDQFEMYEWPGKYAQRFDGVDPNGGDRKDDLQKIFRDSERTTRIRMEQETMPSLAIRGVANCRHLRSGHTFSLSRHFNANGDYLLVESGIKAEQIANYRTGADQSSCEATFTCIPSDLPFRPPLTHQKPSVPGTQTAVVVGPPGEELFTDKYGRVKVQFHWDREGKKNSNSSCWVRVSQPMAGRRWGLSFWPRIGQEVIVDFLEGDPDDPIIVGTVYNAGQMPPYVGDGADPKHKQNNRISGFKTNSTPGGAGYNELRFDDTKGKQQVFIHAEKEMDIHVKNSLRERIGNEKHLIVGNEEKHEGDYVELMHANRFTTVRGNHVERIEGSKALAVVGDQDTIVHGDRKMDISGSSSFRVQGNSIYQSSLHEIHSAGGQMVFRAERALVAKSEDEIQLKAGNQIVLKAPRITLKGGSSFITLDSSGVTIVGIPIKLNSGGSPGRAAAFEPPKAEGAAEANPRKPDPADVSATGAKSS